MIGRGFPAARGAFLTALALAVSGGSHAPFSAGMRCLDHRPVSAEVRAGQGNKVSTYQKGRAVPFGELKPPGFPYPALPQL